MKNFFLGGTFFGQNFYVGWGIFLGWNIFGQDIDLQDIDLLFVEKNFFAHYMRIKNYADIHYMRITTSYKYFKKQAQFHLPTRAAFALFTPVSCRPFSVSIVSAVCQPRSVTLVPRSRPHWPQHSLDKWQPGKYVWLHWILIVSLNFLCNLSCKVLDSTHLLKISCFWVAAVDDALDAALRVAALELAHLS